LLDGKVLSLDCASVLSGVKSKDWKRFKVGDRGSLDFRTGV